MKSATIQRTARRMRATNACNDQADALQIMWLIVGRLSLLIDNFSSSVERMLIDIDDVRPVRFGNRVRLARPISPIR